MDCVSPCVSLFVSFSFKLKLKYKLKAKRFLNDVICVCTYLQYCVMMKLGLIINLPMAANGTDVYAECDI